MRGPYFDSGAGAVAGAAAVVVCVGAACVAEGALKFDIAAAINAAATTAAPSSPGHFARRGLNSLLCIGRSSVESMWIGVVVDMVGARIECREAHRPLPGTGPESDPGARACRTKARTL